MPDEQVHLGGNRHRRELLGRPQRNADHRADPARGTPIIGMAARTA
jgi:hypothetical protein